VFIGDLLFVLLYHNCILSIPLPLIALLCSYCDCCISCHHP